MLNVPESVKALFKQDGIRKNFRVHFPGGELPDITNENVVQESVRFTESLCSQDVLKFGLTEASVLEFETVGVANMYGMTIEAGIEIDLSSLSAAELAEIEAGSWDGVYVSESDTDLGFPFFRVPYGIFRVESCPRDHQAMAHRRVQAYGMTATTVSLSPLEEQKLNKLVPDSGSYNTTIQKLLYASVGYYNPASLESAGFTAATEPFIGNQTVQFTGLIAQRRKAPWGPGPELSGSISVTYNRIMLSQANSDDLFSFTVGNYSLKPLHDFMASIDETYIFVQQPDSLEYNYTSFRSWLAGIAIPRFQYVKIQDVMDYPWGDIPCFYPYRERNSSTYGLIIRYLTEITVRINDQSPYATFIESSTPDNVSDVVLKRYQFNGTSMPITLESTLQRQSATLGTLYSYANSFSFKELFNSFMEIRALFGTYGRGTVFKELRLSKDSPVSIPPGQYKEFWWDEFDVLPIGAVNYTFENQDGEKNTTAYEFDETAPSVYDMTDNVVIEKTTDADGTVVPDLLDEYFIPNLGPIAFTPIDLSMKGLPYLEAGDYLAVMAEDGMIANSFAMRQTISGIQVLTAEIESTSGEVIESEEGET